MPDPRNLLSVDGTAEIEINRIEPTPTLPKGGYQIRITAHDPEPKRSVITVDHDGFAEFLFHVLSDDDSLRTDVRQKLFTRERKTLEDMPPSG
ncbi:MAG TPA: hypothetical protein VF060_27905 [Trebonia sp.]